MPGIAIDLIDFSVDSSVNLEGWFGHVGKLQMELLHYFTDLTCWLVYILANMHPDVLVPVHTD